MKLKFLITYIILIIFLKFGSAQENIDTNKVTIIDSSLVVYNEILPFNLLSPKNVIDTNLVLFDRYEPTHDFLNSYFNLGNIGLPHYNSLNYFINHDLFDFNKNLFSKYWLTSTNYKIYNSLVPYSEILYVTGGKEENYLNLILGSKISKNSYLGIDYRIESSTGSFLNQKSNNSHLRTLYFLNSKNFKNHFSFIYCRNKIKIGENGGLYNDAEYEDSTYMDRKIIRVNLIQAQNLFQNNNFDLEHRFYLGKVDSTQTNKLGYIFTNLQFNSALREYFDQGISNYYSNILIDSSFTHDSTHYNTLNTKFGWTNSNVQKNKILFKIFGEYQKIRFYNHNSLFDYQFVIPHFMLKVNAKKIIFDLNIYQKYLIKTNDSLQIGGNDFFFDSKIKIIYDSNINLSFSLDMESFTPDYDFVRYSGNHFRWLNNFEKTKLLLFTSSAQFYGLNLRFNSYTIGNYVFISPSLHPQQYTKVLQVYQASLFDKFVFKKLVLIPYFIYQNTNNNSVLSVPKYTVKLNANYSFYMFKKAILIDPGINLSFFSSFYANSYNPSIGRFIVQNETEISSHNSLDLFINFKIKRARLLLMYSNFDYLFGNYKYYQIAHYPQKDGILRFGVSWRFYD